MHKRPIESFVIDILISIDKIKRYTKDFSTLELFESCPEIVFDATMRELEILGEALKYVLQSDRLKTIVQPEWRVIVSFRNVIAHEYFGIDYEEIYNALTLHLPVFETQFIDFIKEYPNKIILTELIIDVQEELGKNHRVESIKYLESIKLFLI